MGPGPYSAPDQQRYQRLHLVACSANGKAIVLGGLWMNAGGPVGMMAVGHEQLTEPSWVLNISGRYLKR